MILNSKSSSKKSNKTSKSDSSYNSKSSNSSIMTDDDDDEGSESDDDKKAECIRNRSNFTIPKTFHMIDKKDFNPEILKIYIENDASPKLKLLLEKIRLLDEQDMKHSKKLYKHLIFTDVNRSTYGAKIIASTLTANGMNLVYHPQGKGFSMLDDSELLKTKNNNYAVLLSKSFYDRPVNAKIRKVILDKYNSRPDNIHGELIRFIILDQGFKEGIDLFDVKYVHLFEPLIVNADEKQAIGRATRFCGQKGLEFHPRYGWPLYVFKYDVTIPKEIKHKYMDSQTLFELYIKNSNLDMRKIIFANQLESATIGASVDKELNKAVHTFAIEKPDDILKSKSANKIASKSLSKSLNRTSNGGAVYDIKAPTKIMNLQQMQEFIKNNFSIFAYPPLKLENKCTGGAVNGNIVSFTPTQDFVRHYFQPQSAYKGMLLHHSVGTGKTCTAIATATTSFDVENYTILWVTRHTLKNDIWKNMFGQVCSLDVQQKIKNGLVLPNKITSKFKYISANWLEPISYKQFSNMLLKKNKIYNEMVRRNGTDDPLHKTLLIIDEAHKLYSPTVAKSEKPNTDILEEMIQKSYEKSGKDSVRVLLMTATPFTEDGMEMIKLLNLLKENNKFVTEFNKFSNMYLDDNGYFTNKGLKSFQDSVSGYISYLNRSQDARNFSHPVIKNVYAKMSLENNTPLPVDKNLKIAKESRLKIKEVKAELRDIKKQEKGLTKDIGKQLKECVKSSNNNYKMKLKESKNKKKQEEKDCKKLPKDQKQGCINDVLVKYDELLKRLNIDNENELKECYNKNKEANSNENIKTLRDKKIKLNEEVDKYNSRRVIVRENKLKRKEIRGEVKELNNKRKEIKAEMAEIRKDIKIKKYKFNEVIKTYKKIKDKKERAKAIKDFRKVSPLLGEIKELTKEFKELRSRASKLNTQQQVLKVANGLKRMKNVSQEYAINKYCH
jgi:hypothetical protein